MLTVSRGAGRSEFVSRHVTMMCTEKDDACEEGIARKPLYIYIAKDTHGAKFVQTLSTFEPIL